MRKSPQLILSVGTLLALPLAALLAMRVAAAGPRAEAIPAAQASPADEWLTMVVDVKDPQGVVKDQEGKELKVFAHRIQIYVDRCVWFFKGDETSSIIESPWGIGEQDHADVFQYNHRNMYGIVVGQRSGRIYDFLSPNVSRDDGFGRSSAKPMTLDFDDGFNVIFAAVNDKRGAYGDNEGHVVLKYKIINP
jgi:hypothetical protein